MTDLLLIRHGLPVSGVVQPGLAPEGVEQARRLGAWLKGEDVDVLVTSPMRRARETAAVIAEQMGHPVDDVVEDLREWDTDLPARPYSAVEEMGPTDPRAVAIAEGRYDDFVPELDRDAFRRRVDSCLAGLFERWPVDKIAAVGHGGAINAMVGGLLGIPALFWHNPGYTSVARLRRMPGGRVVVLSVNETAHLIATRD
jgi:2,3-bisphosphoglycerate-dependent phosphoglycerate mutase